MMLTVGPRLKRPRADDRAEELVEVGCVEDGCPATTAVVRAHAANVSTCWRCPAHYSGAWKGVAR